MLKIQKCPLKKLKVRPFYPELPFQVIPVQWNKTQSMCLYSFKFKNESLRQLKTKEQEDDLTSQTLFVLKDMRIRFPGKSDAESELLIEDVSICIKSKEHLFSLLRVVQCAAWDWGTDLLAKHFLGQRRPGVWILRPYMKT